LLLLLCNVQQRRNFFFNVQVFTGITNTNKHLQNNNNNNNNSKSYSTEMSFNRFFTEKSLKVELANSLVFQIWKQAESQKELFDDDVSNINGCVIVGPEHCARNSLLFQYAYNLVNENMDDDPHFSVVFICSKMIPTPLFQQVDDEERHLRILESIKMKYLDTSILFCKYLANLHLLPGELLPRFLFVSDFSTMFSPMHTDIEENNVLNSGMTELSGDLNTSHVSEAKMLDASYMRALALLQNTTAFLTQKLLEKQSGFKPSYIITDSAHLFPFYERWCETVVNVQEYMEQEVVATNSYVPTFSMQYSKLKGYFDHQQMQLVYQVSNGFVAIRKYDFSRRS
jgi:hypothetical protein